MTDRRTLPPVWIMGLTNATFGMMGGFAVITVPEMLAAQGVPGGQIAAIVATILSPGFWSFVLAPMLDVRFARRTYAFVFSLLTAGAAAFTVLHRTNVHAVVIAMFLGYIAASQVQGAVGGWTGSLIDRKDDSKLGAWFAVANTGVGGLMMISGGELVSHLPGPLAALAIAVILMLPCAIYPFIPAPPPDGRLASESFRQFFRDLVSLVQQPSVVRTLILFCLPAAGFALTNVLGGLGRDFSASEHLVSVLAGVGTMTAGVCGSLLVPVLARQAPLRAVYLGIGVVGGLFTLGMLMLPHVPWAFAVVITGQNVFQACSFATVNGITFETIGPKNPLAATQFSLLIAIANLPITYMGYVDGHAYTLGGLRGAYLADALLSITACAALAWGMRRWLRTA